MTDIIDKKKDLRENPGGKTNRGRKNYFTPRR